MSNAETFEDNITLYQSIVYVMVDTELIYRKHLHDRIISLREEFWPITLV